MLLLFDNDNDDNDDDHDDGDGEYDDCGGDVVLVGESPNLSILTAVSSNIYFEIWILI